MASKNPVKIKAALGGFEKMFHEEKFVIEGVSASSSVSDQPMGDGEILKGALSRVEKVSEQIAGDFYVGIEGGSEEIGAEMVAFAWVVIKSRDGEMGKAKTGTFFLPPEVAGLVRQGKELGEADDIVFGRTNSKQQNGATGILTGDVIDRTQFYTEAVILALIPFKNKKLYFEQ